MTSLGDGEAIYRAGTLEDRAILGAGSVLDPSMLAGAGFVVSPVLNKEVIVMCKRYGKTVIPVSFTLTEIPAGWDAREMTTMGDNTHGQGRGSGGHYPNPDSFFGYGSHSVRDCHRCCSCTILSGFLFNSGW